MTLKENKEVKIVDGKDGMAEEKEDGTKVANGMNPGEGDKISGETVASGVKKMDSGREEGRTGNGLVGRNTGARVISGVGMDNRVSGKEKMVSGEKVVSGMEIEGTVSGVVRMDSGVMAVKGALKKDKGKLDNGVDKIVNRVEPDKVMSGMGEDSKEVSGDRVVSGEMETAEEVTNGVEEAERIKVDSGLVIIQEINHGTDKAKWELDIEVGQRKVCYSN